MRDIRFDLLKLISMFGIVSIHTIYHSDILSIVPHSSLEWFMLISLYTVMFAMTNVFVMISSHFLQKSTFKWRKVVNIVFQTSCTSALIYLLLFITDNIDFSLFGFLTSLLAPFTNQYWFITAYLILYILSPYLNIMLKALNKRQSGFLCLFSLFTLSVLPTFLIFLPAQTLVDAQNGKGILWFLCIYILIFYFEKFGHELITKISKRKLTIAFILSCLLLVSSRLILRFISVKLGMSGDGEARLYFDSSFFIFIMSISIYLYTLKSNYIAISLPTGRFIIFLAGSTLGIYLLHDNPNVRNVLWTYIKDIISLSNFPIILSVILASIATFTVCLTIESIRRWIFNLFKNINFNLTE